MTTSATKSVEQLEKENAILREQLAFLAGNRTAPLDNMERHERMRKEREQAAHEARAKSAPMGKREQHRVSAMQLRKELGHVEGCDGSRPCFCSMSKGAPATKDYARDFSNDAVSGVIGGVPAGAVDGVMDPNFEKWSK